MSDLQLYPMQQIVDEMKRRNISFVIAWADHVQFNKEQNREIVWAMDRGGAIPLQITLANMLAGHLQDVEKAVRSRMPKPNEDESTTEVTP